MARVKGKQRGKERGKQRDNQRDTNRVVTDRHILYEAAVQSPEEDVEFVTRIFRELRGRHLRTVREDFCGTAAFSCEFVRRDEDNRAWAIDLDQATLDWGMQNHVARLGADADRVELICADVRTAETPTVDVACAFNFSYWLFEQRDELLSYLRHVRSNLSDDGIFFVDVFGGEEAMSKMSERRRIRGLRDGHGNKIPAFTYVWEQESFNVVDHHVVCHISFKLGDGVKLERAFSYQWRFWSVPEIRDLMRDAGFARSEVYLEGWDDDADEADGVFTRAESAENQAGWVGYVVAMV